MNDDSGSTATSTNLPELRVLESIEDDFHSAMKMVEALTMQLLGSELRASKKNNEITSAEDL